MPRQLAILFLALMLSACGSREFQQLQADRLMAWSGLQSLCQLRAALALNLHSGVRPPMATRRYKQLLQDFPSSLTARAQGRAPLPPWPALR